MDLCIYINTKLTREAPFVPTESSEFRPTYPSHYPLDTLQKDKVLLLSLQSMKRLNVKKVIINVDADEHFKGADEFIKKQAKNIFSNAEVVSEECRPTNKTQWLQSCSFAERFFGSKNPVICMFNHDHIFVDPFPHVFEDMVETIFNQTTDHFVMYSHTPEVVSMTNDYKSHDFRLFRTKLIRAPHSEPKHLGQNLFHVRRSGSIDGLFIACIPSLTKMWQKLSSHSDYIPRPDWLGNSFGEHEFDTIHSQREFFRHFDGYGHVTSMPQMMGMSFSDFDTHGYYKGRKTILDCLSKSEENDIRTKELLESYTKIFSEVYLLMLRDKHFAQINDGKGMGCKNLSLDPAIKTFFRSQVIMDMAYAKIPQIKTQNVLASLASMIYSKKLELFYLITTDANSLEIRNDITQVLKPKIA